MDYNRLKDNVRNIKMSDDMQKRIISNAVHKPGYRSAAVWKKSAAAVIFIALFLTLAVPALAAAVEPIYELMYLVSPSVAQYFQPVRKSDENNGIRMEVVSAYVHGDTAEIYITMQDLTGGRIDETTDLYDSYAIQCPFDSSSNCERVGYDEETDTVTFMITISRMDDRVIIGDKISFSVRKFLSHKRVYKDIGIPVDLSAIREAEQTQKVDLTGGGGLGYNADSFTAVLPGGPEPAFPVEGMDLTRIAFVDGKLHIQAAVRDRLINDNHGYFYLIDADGNEIYCDANYYFTGETEDNRTDYIEYVFSVTPDTLAKCELYGDFWTSGLLTEGNWRVTFPIEKQEGQ